MLALFSAEKKQKYDALTVDEHQKQKVIVERRERRTESLEITGDSRGSRHTSLFDRIEVSGLSEARVKRPVERLLDWIL